jgi:hypothetical protein
MNTKLKFAFEKETKARFVTKRLAMMPSSRHFRMTRYRAALLRSFR